MQVIEKEGISCSKDGLEAIVFTADGDMRQALNNLQATHTGFGDVTADSVFKASKAGGMHTPATAAMDTTSCLPVLGQWPWRWPAAVDSLCAGATCCVCLHSYSLPMSLNTLLVPPMVISGVGMSVNATRTFSSRGGKPYFRLCA